jgi:hypothetical protein
MTRMTGRPKCQGGRLVAAKDDNFTSQRNGARRWDLVHEALHAHMTINREREELQGIRWDRDGGVHDVCLLTAYKSWRRHWPVVYCGAT